MSGYDYGFSGGGSKGGSSSSGKKSSLKELLNPFHMREYDPKGKWLGYEPKTLGGRAVSGLLQLPDTILRGIFNIGKAGYQDLERSAFEGLDAVGLDSDYGKRVREREYQSPELLKEMGLSFANTVDTIGDATYLPNRLMGLDHETSVDQLRERAQQFSDDPAMFALEHIGNAALMGGAVAKPAQLGVAASKGALTPLQALEGLTPITGRAARNTAKRVTSDMADAGSVLGKTIEFTDNVVNHPYRATARTVSNSTPGQLIRNPLLREEALARFRGLWANDEGALNFRPEDPRRRWNEVQEDYQSLSSDGGRDFSRLETELGTLENELRSQGYEVPARGEQFRLDSVDPKDLITEEDFAFTSTDGDFGSDGFWRNLSNSLNKEIEYRGIRKEPDTVDLIRYNPDDPTSGADVFYTNQRGDVVGVLSVDKLDINVAVDPAFRGQGIAKKMVERAIAEGLPIQEAALGGNVRTSQYGTALMESFRKRAESGELNLEPNPLTSGPDPETLWTPEEGGTLYHGTRRMEAADGIRREGFRPSESGESGAGIYLTPDRATADRMALRWRDEQNAYVREGDVLEVQTELGNVLNRNSAEGERVFRAAEQEAYSRGNRQLIGEVLQEQGYNAIRHDHGGQHEIVVLDPSRLTVDPPRVDPLTGTRSGGDNSYRGAGEETFRTSAFEMLRDILGGESGELRVFDKSKQGTSIGPIDLLANEIGLGAKTFRESEGWQQLMGADARAARGIRHDLRTSIVTGRGNIANEVEGMIGTQTGNQALRRRHDPLVVERLVMRDLRNLTKRPDAERFVDLIAELDMPDTAIGRAAQATKGVPSVATGNRAIGSTLGSTDVVTLVDRVMAEAHKQSGGNPAEYTKVLQEIMPGVDPQGFYLMGLNAIEATNNLPTNSLLGALGDFIQMDEFAFLNRRAQAALQQGGNNVTPERFRLPTEELGVDINMLSEAEQRIFYEAADLYFDRMPRREQTLVNEGQIPEAGSRLGLQSDEPTQFPTQLDELPLTSDWRTRLDKASREKKSQARNVSRTKERLDELSLTRPSQRATQTQQAVERWRKKLGEEREKLVQLSSQLEDLENQAIIDPSNAPASARNLMNYARNVAPQQARVLREMADNGIGNPEVMKAMADELDAVPATLQDMNDSNVYLAYLKDMKDRGVEGHYGPGSVQGINTRSPSRRRGTDTDIDYSRDFRARTYWQDAEYQSFFMNRQADEAVRRQGLAKTGTSRLKESGYSAEEIADMSPNRAQQALERAGWKTYHPDQIFASGRKPMPPGTNPLDADWIAPHIEKILLKTLEAPSGPNKFLSGTYDPLMKAWKVTALPLRFGWQVNNAAGNALLTMLHAKVSPMDYVSLFRASARAVHGWNQGIPQEVRVSLRQAHKQEMIAKLNTLEEGSPEAIQIRNSLDRGEIVLDNSVLNDISSSGLTRGDFAWLNNSQFLRDMAPTSQQSLLQQFGIKSPRLPDNLGGKHLKLGTRFRNYKATGKEFVDFAYHVNEAVDNFHRTMIYLDQAQKGGSHAEGITQATKALGDYQKLSTFEQQWVKRVYPFYPWMRHITEVVASSLHPEHIQRAVIFSHITATFGKPNEWEALLPEYAGGHIYMGEDENGLPKFLSTRGLNPFLDVFDPVSQPNGQGLLRPASPLIQWGFERVSGNSVLTGRPFSSPSGDPNARPPASEYLFRNVPQLGAARNVARDLQGEPLTRYGTGEPAFFGNEETRSGMQSVTQLFGVNVRPMDVVQMNNQEKRREFQIQQRERKHKAEVEHHRGGGHDYGF